MWNCTCVLWGFSIYCMEVEATPGLEHPGALQVGRTAASKKFCEHAPVPAGLKQLW